ncbi:MAG TPA: NTP transferase domain-containing protein, partial [Candidatus Acidoferrales bacterium]|nr:NTP transferase domain-containing protein [Candidatus Acidoferrales bacterium]
MKNLGVILLAAGQGTRMKSSLPKVLHPLAGKPLFLHTLGVAQQLKPATIAVVVGHGAGAVKDAYTGADVAWVTQEQQLGTGHAVLCAQAILGDFCGDVVILSGDVPLIQERTLAAMVKTHREHGAAQTLMTAMLDSPTGYGRILRDANGEINGIVEEKDASAEQRKIQEVNAGVYVAAPQFLFAALQQVKNDNRQAEYYLPDVAAIGLQEGKKIATFRVDDPGEMMGINTKEELARMEKTLQERINRKWMSAGVTLKDPATTYIEEAVSIGKDTVIGPNTHLRGRTVVGERCEIDGSAYITDAEIDDE